MLRILPPVLQQIRLLQVEPLSYKCNKNKKLQHKLYDLVSIKVTFCTSCVICTSNVYLFIYLLGLL